MDACVECKKEDDARMVSCFNCGGKYHWDCAQITEAEAQRNWRCKGCAAVQESAERAVQGKVQPEAANKSLSVSSASSRVSSRKARRLQAELQIVDEELAMLAEKRKLLEQHETLMQRRKELLQQQTDANGDNESVSTVASIRQSRCHDWVHQSEVVTTAEREVINTAKATAVQQPQNKVSINEDAEERANELQTLRLAENTVRSGRAEITSASQWVPGLFPMSSTVNTNAATRELNVSQPNVSATFRLTPEQIAARKGLAKDLPSFTGKPEEWTLFMATYEQTTQLCGFSDEENLIRLRHALDGVARNSVKSLLLNAACVPQILSTLRMKFGRPELIIDILLNQIRDMPPPKENRLETIVDFAIEVQNVCATMKAANMTNYLNNPELEQELVCKLPGLLAAFWGMHKSTLATSSLEDFSEWLFQLAQGANSVMLPSTSTKAFRRGGNVNTHSPAAAPKGLSSTGCIICNGCCTDIASCNRYLKMGRADKWRTIRRHRLCKTCLLPHFPQSCTSSLRCNIDNCNMDHHATLHKKAPPAQQVVPSVSVNCNTHHCYNSNPILFRILPVTVYGNGVKIPTYAFLDDGSSLTLVDKELFNVLNIQGKRQPLCMQWTSKTQRNEDDSVVSSFEVAGADPQKKFLLREVHTVKKLDLPLQSVDAKTLSRQYKHLRGIPLASYTNVAPRILIGLNNTRVGQTLKSKEGGENQPIAEKTRLGWTVKGGAAITSGPMVDAVNYHTTVVSGNDSNAAEELLAIVRDYIVNDNYIDLISERSGDTSYEDQIAMKQLENLTRRVDNYFETGLLWRCRERLPEGSFFMAKKRAMGLHSKMEKDEHLEDILQSKIAEYISKGYARKLLPSELQIDRCWYLPIFPVTNPNKPSKVRLVWDAAAKVQGISLNTMLLKGPDQLTSMVAVIRRFRQKRVAIGGDIAEMFHQVRMRKEDQQFQRFLWRESCSLQLETYVMTVMTFGASCSPSCAQYVKNLNAKEFSHQYPRAAQSIIENHYVDDMLDSVDSEEEAIQLAKDVRFVHAQAGFHIRNWVSNSSKVLKALNAPTVEQISFKTESDYAAEKVLGMWWDMATDSFVYKISHRYRNSDLLSGKQRPTKREVLSLIMTVFDPLGLLGFFVIFAKIIFQETWRTGCGWDEKIGDDQHAKWLRWIRCLPEVESIQIPRCYTTLNSKNICRAEVHTFVDASEEAYAAVSYLRCTDGYEVDVSLLGCKTKLAPLKMQSIPRLELQGAVVGARLAKSLGESLTLEIHKYIFWTDSSTVLSWLSSDHRRYKQFVAFRISEIVELTDINNWRWVPTNENVADEATKWKRTPEFCRDSRWLNGPSFLKLPASEWPERVAKPSLEIEKELRACYVGHHRPQNVDSSSLLSVLAERISTWKRLVRVVTSVRRSVRVWKNLKSRTPASACTSQGDICASERLLFKEAQKDFLDEIVVLSDQRSVSKSSPLYKLSPYVDDNGLLRLGGRVNLLCGYDPIIMPRRHRITNLLILDFHSRYHHGNNETVVNEIRQHFWISQLRTEVYKARRSCQLCRNRAAQPKPPRMASLPHTRVAAFCRPFSYVGVDYFGPLMVSVRRSQEKRYGVLLTCLTTRAIHLEIAYSLSTDSCVMAVRNFIARRGVPLEIWSDNGTNFRGAEREMSDAFETVNKNELIRAFTTSTTKWSFIPPASPHMGGAWERLVRSVKSVLLNVLKTRTPTDELLRAALMEVEMTVNSRPLTYIPVDPEVQEALTPNHFLLGSSDGTKPLVEGVTDGILLRRAWQTSQQVANAFWKRWIKEYLPIITRRSKWFNYVKPIEVNDIVYIVDPGNPRNSWPKGKVIAVRTGGDGQVRSATIKTSTGVYIRPATMVAVLEVKGDVDEVDPDEDIPGGSVE